MKKILSILLFLITVALLSVTALADEKPARYFLSESLSEEAVSYACESGFTGIIADLRNAGRADAPDDTELEYYYLGTSENVKELSGRYGAENVLVYLPYGEDAGAMRLLAKSGYCSGILCDMPLSSYSEYGYEEYLKDVLLGADDVKVITFNRLDRILCPVSSGDFFGDVFEMNSQYLINAESGIQFCVSDYKALRENRYSAGSSLVSFFGDTVLSDFAGFSVSQKFEITRPTKSEFTTELAKYTIFGTSDPSAPLYMDGAEIERISSSGLFAVTVEVPKTCTFSQSGKSFTVTIKKPTPKSGDGSGKISKITAAGPSNPAIARFGEEYTFACIGPGNAAITATLGDYKIEMVQNAVCEDGTPARYTGTIVFDDPEKFPSDEVTNIGNVKYRLSYMGNTTTCESDGEVFVAGKSAKIAVTATTEMAGVEAEPKTAGNYLTTLRTGCSDYVQDDLDGWYRISCGGYLPISHCTFVTGKTDIQNRVGSYYFIREGENTEEFEMECSSIPAFVGELGRYHLALTLYNTDFPYDEVESQGTEFLTVIRSEQNGDGSVTLHFCSKAPLWGWDIFTDPEHGKMTVVIKKEPVLSRDSSKPLAGVTVAVCAGHGGYDPGALSVAGETGVNEFMINRANAMAIISSLENLGANVIPIIAEEGGDKLDSYQRTDPARYGLADVYVCCHANSVAENAPANVYCGTQVYYHYDGTSLFSQKLVDYISLATKRDNEGSHQDYYTVTRLTLCPAVMLEVGYVSNPSELDSLISDRDIEKTAFAVTKAVLEICDN